MKIAIFHNFLDNIGGAEIVSLTLARELGADIYSTNVDQEKIEKMGFGDIMVRSIGRVPINAPLKQQLAWWRFRFLNLKNQYDFFIISGDWAMSGAVKNRPNLWYVHSPIREIWDLYEYTRNNTVPSYLRPMFDGWVVINRFFNRRYIKQVDKIVCNSVNTQNRVSNYLKRDAAVINPPINTAKFYFRQSGNFWLSVNRLISHKKIEIQLEAFRQLPHEKLIIVGSYEKSRHFQSYAKYIKDYKPANVEIRSWVEFEELVNLYADCKGFITTAFDEDFGMAAVEAMASGKPVIAPNQGGYRETVVNGLTGLLIDDLNADRLVSAMIEISKEPLKFKSACLEQAKKFDTKFFIEKIVKLLN
ncbi:MAG: glycosyltransferase [Patescibacteria group bacterium]|jgi:glycosyltransferase involved in cell wall biosynthesis|nr:glycosyltransferase [Patescibacteria group bacterium]